MPRVTLRYVVAADSADTRCRYQTIRREQRFAAATPFRLSLSSRCLLRFSPCADADIAAIFRRAIHHGMLPDIMIRHYAFKMLRFHY